MGYNDCDADVNLEAVRPPDLWAPLTFLKTSGAHSYPRCGWNPVKDISHQEDRQYDNSLYLQFLFLFSSMVFNLRPNATTFTPQVFYHMCFTLMKDVYGCYYLPQHVISKIYMSLPHIKEK